MFPSSIVYCRWWSSFYWICFRRPYLLLVLSFCVEIFHSIGGFVLHYQFFSIYISDERLLLRSVLLHNSLGFALPVLVPGFLWYSDRLCWLLFIRNFYPCKNSTAPMYLLRTSTFLRAASFPRCTDSSVEL